MESLRINNENIYEIEVNDKGETIKFDLLDVSLPFRLAECIKKYQKSSIEYARFIKSDKNFMKDIDSIKKYEEVTKKYYDENRSAFDELLGEGACKKIFGDVNRYGMFEDFIEKIQPHLDKMQIDINNVKKRLVETYKIKDDSIL